MKIAVIKITNKDSNFILKLRNDKNIRKYSHNQKIISTQIHNNWFKQKLKRKEKLFFIIKVNNSRAGFIRYEKKDFYYVVSLGILRKFQSKGIASEALAKSEKQFNNTMIISIVKYENKKSIKFFINNEYNILSSNKIIYLYKILSKKKNLKYNKLINQIQKIRKKNNVNWMDILKIAFESSPIKTKKVFENIFRDDENINLVSKKFFS